MSGPRGGKLSTLKVQSEIAARIYTSDIVIAPSRPAIARASWVTWEVQLAAIGYGIPILFVNERGLKNQAKLVTEVSALGLAHRACNPEKQDIVKNVVRLAGDSRPNWAMRPKETDRFFQFRGPTSSALDDVMKKHPFRPAIASFDPPQAPPKRPRWSPFPARPKAS